VLHVGLDLSPKRVEVCLMSDQGELLDGFEATPDRDGLYGLARRVAVYGEPVRGVVESMNGARFVYDELSAQGWEVLVADAQKVKGLAPLACKTDKIDSRVLAELSFRDLVPAIWLPTLELRREREISRWRLHLVKHRSTLKNRVHSTLITFGHQRHMSDLFGVAGRRLLKELEMPEPWRSHVDASLQLIGDLEARITQIAKDLRRSGADHRYIPLQPSASRRWHSLRPDPSRTAPARVLAAARPTGSRGSSRGSACAAHDSPASSRRKRSIFNRCFAPPGRRLGA
jgi:transposase